MPADPELAPRALPPHAPLAEYYRSEAERRRLLDHLFDRSARDYAWIDASISLGCGARYRRAALLRAGLRPGMQVLDVAVGTGAVAREAMRLMGSSGRVVGIDPSRGMLAEARTSLRLPVVQGLAERLPFREATFDFLSLGYALRHVADLRQLFAEIHRVLRPGGRLLALDFGRPRSRAGYHLARLLLGHVVPRVVSLRSSSGEARVLMRYCWSTIERSVPPETIEAAVAASGLQLSRRSVYVGIFSEHLAIRPPRDPSP